MEESKRPDCIESFGSQDGEGGLGSILKQIDPHIPYNYNIYDLYKIYHKVIAR